MEDKLELIGIMDLEREGNLEEARVQEDKSEMR